jgi:hypothetical protein
MAYVNITVKEFIKEIITHENIYSILKKCQSQMEKGFVFERLFDIITKFGFCSRFSNKQFTHKIGNVNKGVLKNLTNLQRYIEKYKVYSGKTSGCSDITLYDNVNKEYVFISSKYPKTDEEMEKQKSVDYYDIQNILGVVLENKHIYTKYKIYLLVPNKRSVLEKVKKADPSSDYITKYMKEEFIFDRRDLNEYFLLFKESIIKNNIDNVNKIYLNPKVNLQLRFHQELITRKTSNLIEEGNKSFLWGCKCRSGKTFMVGGLINKQKQIKGKLNVLIITPAPSETIPQFTDELFNKFKEFNDFKVHQIEGSNEIERLELSENNIFVMSKQLLQRYIKNDTITKIKDLKLDIICFDENHFTGTTDLSKNILNSYSYKNTIKVYLTATYNKPLQEWNIIPECQMYWDLEDEQNCKSILTNESNIEQLKEKHGKIYVNETIKYYNDLGLTIKDIFKQYEQMPNLHLISNVFDSQRYEIIKEHLDAENKIGFCFDTLFSLNKEKNKFSFESEVKTMLRYISGSFKEKDGEKTIFTRINNICSEKNTRVPFTQIWFLPSDNINEISKCLEKLMEEDIILKKYKILCINRKNKLLAKDVKEKINTCEIEAKNEGLLGVILLAGNMLSLGITLNLCDCVILMNNSLSSDKVLQQMYRCMTEGENKKYGFVVDLNVSRILNTFVSYNIHKRELSTDEKVKYLIEKHLINIDVDMMENKNLNVDDIVKKLMNIWKEDPVNNFRSLLKHLDDDYTEFDTDTQKLINNTFTKSITSDKVNMTIKFNEEDYKDFPTGKEKVKVTGKKEEGKIEEEEKAEEIQISFTKDVLPYIIPLSCILTIKNKNNDFVKMLNEIKENKDLLEIFNEQCFIWWSKKDLIDLIKSITDKYFNKSSNTYNIAIQFKLSLQSLIEQPKELLELINVCLKPKETEKKQFGEVFTPMKLVNEMLDKLPSEVWKNKNLTWYDPANGMGNFPIAVYLRLMESLKEEITDEKERKKHILEKMLYMSELNKKNCLICGQIFDINGEYKLNLYNGDSLSLDIKKQWNIDKFDIIMGNPPYQEAKATGDNKLYLKFTKKSINILNKNSYLLFITPRNILEYLFLSEKNRKFLDKFYQIQFIAIETINKYFPNIGSSFTYFLIETKLYSENTSIEYQFANKINKVELRLEKGFKIPRILTQHDISILSKITSKTENYLFNDFLFGKTTQRIRKQHFLNGTILLNQTKTHNIKIIDTINKTNVFPGKYYYYDKKDNDFEKDKLVLSKKGYIMSIIDKTKNYTYSDNFKYIIDDDIDKIKMLFDSDIIKYLLFQYSKNGFDSLSIIQMIKKENIHNIFCEDELYKIYNLTDEEKAHIKSILM